MFQPASRFFAALKIATLIPITSMAMSVTADDKQLNPAESATAIAALKPLEAFAGEFDVKVSYGPLAAAKETRPGTFKCRMRAGGFAFTIEKHEDAVPGGGDEYDDLMVFTYNAETAKVQAVLYQGGVTPRHISVEMIDKSLILSYDPLKSTRGARVTREEINLEDKGAVRWQVKAKQAGEDFSVSLEMLGTPKAPVKP